MSVYHTESVGTVSILEFMYNNDVETDGVCLGM